MWSTLLGLGFSLLRLDLPEWIDVTLTMIGNLLIPMVLLPLGARLAEAQAKQWRAGGVGAIASPAVRIIAALVLMLFLPLFDVERGAFLLFAALPPPVLNYLLADRFGRDQERVASIVMAGHLASVVVLPAALAVVLM